MNSFVLGIILGSAVTLAVCVLNNLCSKKKLEEKKNEEDKEEKTKRNITFSEIELYWKKFIYEHTTSDVDIKKIVYDAVRVSPYTSGEVKLLTTSFMEIAVNFRKYSLGSLFFRVNVNTRDRLEWSKSTVIRLSFKDYLDKEPSLEGVDLVDCKIDGFLNIQGNSVIEKAWMEKFYKCLQEEGYVEASNLPDRKSFLDIFNQFQYARERAFFFIQKDSLLFIPELSVETPEASYRANITHANKLRESSLREAIFSADWVGNQIGTIFKVGRLQSVLVSDLVFGNDIQLPMEESFIHANTLIVQQNEFLYKTKIAIPVIEHTMDQIVSIYKEAIEHFFSDYGVPIEIFYLEEESSVSDPEGEMKKYIPAEYTLTFRIAEVRKEIGEDLHS